MIVYARINDEGTAVVMTDLTRNGNPVLATVRNESEYIAAWARIAGDCGFTPADFVQRNVRLVCSSSIDFANEYTSDADLLKLCDWISRTGDGDEASQ